MKRMRYPDMNRSSVIKFLIISTFAIAMGYLESAVVVYLREIFYPGGFAFPLKSMTGKIAVTEVFRELATIIMLAGVGYLTGKNRIQRFGIFLYAFGIWDIFYYVFLYILIGWPQSLFTWDILFLIPVTWVGPVLAPSLNALTMCALGGLIFFYEERNILVSIGRIAWALLIIGSAIILVSYTQDYLHYMVARMPLTDIFKPSEADKVLGAAGAYVPERFNWWVFGVGQGMLMVAVITILTSPPGPLSLRRGGKEGRG
jgi:hypothetical protein